MYSQESGKQIFIFSTLHKEIERKHLQDRKVCNFNFIKF